MNWLVELDGALLRLINYPAHRLPALDQFVSDVAESNFLKGGLLLAVYWAFWFGAGKDDKQDCRRFLIAALASAAVIAIVARLLQLGLPFHPRPIRASPLPIRMPFSVTPNALNAWGSFPSDHAVFFFALCVPIWRLSRRLGSVAFLWTLFVVCVPRVYLGYHYPSDILGGAVIGIGLMLVLQRVIAATKIPDWVIGWERPHIKTFYAIAFLFCFELSLLFGDFRHFGVDVNKMAHAVFVSGKSGAGAQTRKEPD